MHLFTAKASPGRLRISTSAQQQQTGAGSSQTWLEVRFEVTVLVPDGGSVRCADAARIRCARSPKRRCAPKENTRQRGSWKYVPRYPKCPEDSVEVVLDAPVGTRLAAEPRGDLERGVDCVVLPAPDRVYALEGRSWLPVARSPATLQGTAPWVAGEGATCFLLWFKRATRLRLWRGVETASRFGTDSFSTTYDTKHEGSS